MSLLLTVEANWAKTQTYYHRRDKHDLHPTQRWKNTLLSIRMTHQRKLSPLSRVCKPRLHNGVQNANLLLAEKSFQLHSLAKNTHDFDSQSPRRQPFTIRVWNNFTALYLQTPKAVSLLTLPTILMPVTANSLNLVHKIEAKGRFLFHTSLPASDISLNTYHTIHRLLPHCWWRSHFRCPRTMVCCNSLLLFCFFLYFKRAITYFPGCQNQSTMTDVFYHPHFHIGYLLSLSVPPFNCFAQFWQFSIIHSGFSSSKFTFHMQCINSLNPIIRAISWHSPPSSNWVLHPQYTSLVVINACSTQKVNYICSQENVCNLEVSSFWFHLSTIFFFAICKILVPIGRPIEHASRSVLEIYGY